MKETGERAHSLPLSLADSVGCAHSGTTLFCSPHAPPLGYACVMKPRLSEEKAMMMTMKKMAALVLLAFLLTAPAAAGGTWAAQHFWDEGGSPEARSAAWQETSVWCWSSRLCGQ